MDSLIIPASVRLERSRETIGKAQRCLDFARHERRFAPQKEVLS